MQAVGLIKWRGSILTGLACIGRLGASRSLSSKFRVSIWAVREQVGRSLPLLMVFHLSSAWDKQLSMTDFMISPRYYEILHLLLAASSGHVLDKRFVYSIRSLFLRRGLRREGTYTISAFSPFSMYTTLLLFLPYFCLDRNYPDSMLGPTEERDYLE